MQKQKQVEVKKVEMALYPLKDGMKIEGHEIEGVPEVEYTVKIGKFERKHVFPYPMKVFIEEMCEGYRPKAKLLRMEVF